jgi:hypothetical protein
MKPIFHIYIFLQFRAASLIKKKKNRGEAGRYQKRDSTNKMSKLAATGKRGSKTEYHSESKKSGIRQAKLVPKSSREDDVEMGVNVNGHPEYLPKSKLIA